MGSSTSTPKLFDPVRKQWVEKKPEEEIRIRLLIKMIEELGFPPSLLSVEKELSKLPHLSMTPYEKLPKRRADIIAFAKDIHPSHAFFPLLLVECKALDLNAKFIRQVVGYNAFVQAPFVALANEKHLFIGFFDAEKKGFCFQEGLPSYASLISSLSR